MCNVSSVTLCIEFIEFLFYKIQKKNCKEDLHSKKEKRTYIPYIYIVNHRNSLTPQNPLTLNQTYLKTVDVYKILFTYTKFYADSENEFRFF